MKEIETSAARAAAKSKGNFHVSAQPVVSANSSAPPEGGTAGGLPASYGTDLLYVIARDPKSLFLYWDLNWTRLFAQAGLSARQVHLRTYRADGSIEATREINPFRGHYYAAVAAAGAEYYCELGCFDRDAWKSLLRSGTTATPEAGLSDDFSTDFATLPIHLSFERLIELLGAAQADRTTLACSMAELQENARTLQEMLKGGNSGEGNGAEAELAALLETARRGGVPTAEQLAQWKQLGERYGGASWGGASGSGFGGSSPA